MGSRAERKVPWDLPSPQQAGREWATWGPLSGTASFLPSSLCQDTRLEKRHDHQSCCPVQAIAVGDDMATVLAGPSLWACPTIGSEQVPMLGSSSLFPGCGDTSIGCKPGAFVHPDSTIHLHCPPQQSTVCIALTLQLSTALSYHRVTEFPPALTPTALCGQTSPPPTTVCAYSFHSMMPSTS